jgi:hypothetical protein
LKSADDLVCEEDVHALGFIVQHSPELKHSVIGGEAIVNIAPLMKVSDGKLKQFVCSTLVRIAKQLVDSAHLIVESGIFRIASGACWTKTKEFGSMQRVFFVGSANTLKSCRRWLLITGC